MGCLSVRLSVCLSRTLLTHLAENAQDGGICQTLCPDGGDLPRDFDGGPKSPKNVPWGDTVLCVYADKFDVK